MLNQPRTVKLRTVFELLKRHWFILYLGLMFLVVPSFMAIMFYSIFASINSEAPIVDYPSVLSQGTTTTGVITDIDRKRNMTINNQNPAVISYSYNVDGDTVESKFVAFDEDRLSMLSIGDLIQVKYLGNDSVIVDLDRFEFPMWLHLFFSVFAVVGLAPIIYVAYKVNGEIFLYKYGKVTVAEVLSVTRVPGTPIMKRGQGSRVSYQYKSGMNKVLLGEVFTPDLLPSNSWKHGDSIKIFVSPRDESKSTLIPPVEAARNFWKID